jgi:hypothetical protein
MLQCERSVNTKIDDLNSLLRSHPCSHASSANALGRIAKRRRLAPHPPDPTNGGVLEGDVVMNRANRTDVGGEPNAK